MKRRNILTMSERAQIIKEMENGLTNADMCKKYNLHSSTVSTFWKRREAILKHNENNVNLKRIRPYDRCEFDEPLYEWYKSMISQNKFVNGSLLQAQAKKIARRNGDMEFKCSDNWIASFKRRHSISFNTSNISRSAPLDRLTSANKLQIKLPQTSEEAEVIYIDDEDLDPIKVEEEASFVLDLGKEEDANYIDNYSDGDQESTNESLNSTDKYSNRIADTSTGDKTKLTELTNQNDVSVSSASTADARSALHTLYTFYENNYNHLDPTFFEHYAKLKVMIDAFHRNSDQVT